MAEFTFNFILLPNSQYSLLLLEVTSIANTIVSSNIYAYLNSGTEYSGVV